MSDFSAGYEIPGHFKRQFSDTWDMVLQQRNQKFANAGIVKSDWTAKDYIWQDLEQIEAIETTGLRLGDTQVQELTGGARRGYQRQFDVGVIRDKWDNDWLDRQAIPDGDVISTMRAAANRKLDDVFIEAATATVFGGADPYTTPITLPATSEIAVNYVQTGTPANSGLTPWKLLEVKKRMGDAEVDTDQTELYIALGEKQIFDLAVFASTAVTDFWAKVVAEWLALDAKGTPAKLMGFNVIKTNRLARNASTDVRTCVAFAREGFRVSPITQSLTIDRLPTKRNAIQFLSQMSFGAVRAKDQMVYAVYCDESP